MLVLFKNFINHKIFVIIWGLEKILYRVFLNKSIFKKKRILLNLLSSTFIFSFVNTNIIKSEEINFRNNSIKDKNFQSDLQKSSSDFKEEIDIDYLNSKEELKDYIIDSGDTISLDFLFIDELDGSYNVNAEGEILLPRLEDTYVRGLTTSELSKLLEKRYSEYLINPTIKTRVIGFKPIRVLINGEVRFPGIYKFNPKQTFSSFELPKKLTQDETQEEFSENNESEELVNNQQITTLENFDVKRNNSGIITISDAIKKANGITSKSDLSRIEIIRDVPFGKGGGKKRAFVDFTDYLNEGDTTNDIRLFDGDKITIPSLNKANPEQIPKSILSGLSPKYISVQIFGRIDSPGSVILPLESTLSDAIDISGPIKPLSGKIILIRYLNNGKVVKLNVPFNASAKRGSKRNPYIKEGDLISVKNSILGRSTGVIKEVTEPFIGIYATKELIESFD